MLNEWKNFYLQWRSVRSIYRIMRVQFLVLASNELQRPVGSWCRPVISAPAGRVLTSAGDQYSGRPGPACRPVISTAAGRVLMSAGAQCRCQIRSSDHVGRPGPNVGRWSVPLQRWWRPRHMAATKHSSTYEMHTQGTFKYYQLSL